jgi:hypothetical protein
MFKPSAAMMTALRDFVFRHEIFVEARESKDAEAARALFGYVQSESRLLLQVLGDAAYKELLGVVRRHRNIPRGASINELTTAVVVSSVDGVIVRVRIEDHAPGALPTKRG